MKIPIAYTVHVDRKNHNKLGWNYNPETRKLKYWDNRTKYPREGYQYLSKDDIILEINRHGKTSIYQVDKNKKLIHLISYGLS